MAAYRRLLLSYGLLGSIFVIMLCFYGWDKLQHKSEKIKLQAQEQRKQQVKETCCDYKLELSEGKRGADGLSNYDLKHFLVDDAHGIIYCYVPKVACTNWKKVMYVLKQSEPYCDPKSLPDNLIEPTEKHLTLLNSFPRTERMAKLKHYTKFMFVRIISAYRDKFQRLNKGFYYKYAQDILYRYGNQSDPPHSVEKAFELGVRPSFHNFIQYLVDPRIDPHWKQMHRLCHPCHIQ